MKKNKHSLKISRSYGDITLDGYPIATYSNDELKILKNLLEKVLCEVNEYIHLQTSKAYGLVIVSNIIIGCHKIDMELMVSNFQKVALKNSSEETYLGVMSQQNLKKNSLCIDRLQCTRLFAIDAEKYFEVQTLALHYSVTTKLILVTTLIGK